eukprot:13747606-Ditylum_brightwellii.AAC.1
MEIRWLEWLDSLHKDVECTFGIMKGRFWILKIGIQCHGFEVVNKIWATCCSLHNFLLEEDGLDEKWEEGIPSDYEGELGLHDECCVKNIRNTCTFALSRLNNPSNCRSFDCSGMGAGNDQTLENDVEVEDEAVDIKVGNDIAIGNKRI